MTVSCPYGDIKLCPVRALKLWQQTGGLTAGPVFRKIRLPPGHKAAAAGRVSHASDRQRRDHPPYRGADLPGTRPGGQLRRRDRGGHNLKRGALTAGTHVLNILHRLTDGGGTAAVINAPQALVLRQEPRSDIERYDALRDREVRHAS